MIELSIQNVIAKIPCTVELLSMPKPFYLLIVERSFPLFAGKRYPVYLFHWHPAKSQFEWRRDLDIKHSFRAVLAGQYFANFFVRQGELYDFFAFR